MRGIASGARRNVTGWIFALLAGVTAAYLPACAETSAAIPQGSEAAGLVRDTLADIDDANRSGSYAALRESSAPDFKTRFTNAAIAALFRDMRAQGIDLALAVALEPKIELARFLAKQNVLQIYGTVRTAPVETRFLFSYQMSGDAWKLYGLALDFKKTPESIATASKT